MLLIASRHNICPPIAEVDPLTPRLAVQRLDHLNMNLNLFHLQYTQPYPNAHLHKHRGTDLHVWDAWMDLETLIVVLFIDVLSYISL